MTDSNRRHLRCKRSALPTELIAHSVGVNSCLSRQVQAASQLLCRFVLAYTFAEVSVVGGPDFGGFVVVEEGQEGVAAAFGYF